MNDDNKFNKRKILVERTRLMILSGICLALNIGLGKISNILSLPFTMDTIGTIIASSLLPWYWVLSVGAASSVLASFIIHPIFLFFIGTQIAIGISSVIFVRYDMFTTPYKALFSGLCIGIVSAIVSSPVIAIVFGGISVPSISAVNALLLASGKSLWESVIGGSLVVESIDKMAAGYVSFIILQRLTIIKSSSN